MAALPLLLTLSEKKTQDKINSVQKQINDLICRAKGSCSPKIAQAVASVGIAGYRLGTTQKWNYYHTSGVHLTFDLTKFYNAQAWYLGSGYWEKLKNAGLDACCLKDKWPPAEAFPLAGASAPTSFVKLPDGREIEIDPKRFDMTAFQREVDEFFRTKGNDVSIIPQNTTTVTAPLGGMGVLPLLALAFLGAKS